MSVYRQRITAEIERLIGILDELDGDPDLEIEEAEEQHDAEASLTWQSDEVPAFYVIAERARRRAREPH